MTSRDPDAARLDALLESDRPEPSPDFDARFAARLAEAETPDAWLDGLLDADRPEPSPGFDARFEARLAEIETPDAWLDGLLDADRPEPSPGFDARFEARLAAEQASAESGSTQQGNAERRQPGARILRFVRRPAVLGSLLAAAAAFTGWVMTRPAPDPPPDAMGLLGHLELLEVYGEMEVLDGIADDETFELVAMLHTLDDEEARP